MMPWWHDGKMVYCYDVSTGPRNSATRKDMFQPLNIKKEKKARKERKNNMKQEEKRKRTKNNNTITHI